MPILTSLTIFSGTPGGTRTPNLVVRTHLLYPVELPGHTHEANLRFFSSLRATK